MTNPLLSPWTGAYGLPPFAEVRAEQFARGIRGGDARSPRRDRRARGIERSADLRQYRRRARPSRSPARARQRAVLQPHVERDFARAAGGAARHGAAARGARQPRLHPRCAVRSHRRAARTARPHRARLGAASRPGALPPRLRPRRRQAGAARAGALRGDHAAARRADDALRPERPRRRERVPPRPRGRSRSRRPAGVRPRRGATGGARARHRRRRGDHAVALAHRPVPHLFRAARPARSRLAGVDFARRAGWRERQPRRRRRDPRSFASSRHACMATRATPTSRSATRWRAARRR